MRFAFVCALSIAACGGADETGEETTVTSNDGDRDHAIEVARTLGAANGYAAAEYELESAERVAEGAQAGHWLVQFVHVPPAPPGGHFGVYVDPATWQGEIRHGE